MTRLTCSQIAERYFGPDHLGMVDHLATEEEDMRGLSKVVATLAVGMLLITPALRAQGGEFSLGGGIGLPLGTFDDSDKLGWHGLAAFSVVPNGWPVGIQIDGQYQQFKRDAGIDAGVKDRFLMGTANLVLKLKSSDETHFRPYLIGGGGVYNMKATGSNDAGTVISTTGSTTKFGLNAGAGFDYKAGGAGFFIEGRFHDVFTAGENRKFIPITVGIRFGGS